jgi:hypothetical protein
VTGLAMVGKVAVGVEQIFEERRSNSGRGERNGWWSPVVTSGRRDKGARPRGAAMTGGH